MTFSIVPIGAAASLILAFIVVFLIGIGAVTIVVIRKRPEIPSPAAWFALVGGSGLPFVLALGFGYFLFGGHLSNVTLAEGVLQINIPIYGRSVPLDRIDLESPRVIDMTASREVQLTLRTNGLGVPGYLLGWFRVAQDGRALVALTDRSTVAWVRLTDGTALLFSLRDPDAFLDALQAAGDGLDEAQDSPYRLL